ncbi:sterile alpha motif domain-containing protein 9-like, partial [Trichomycterus rosablanca]|uniref:sterile alpha motif domain-containing protein 9-like n=1 Tax=Trichomycterus rosablanca TaxID=2290929 RepID=UPI002F35A680
YYYVAFFTEYILSTPVETWTASMVSKWLASIEVKKEYIMKLHEQEVDGQALLTIKEKNLKKKTGMKQGSALWILENRDELVDIQKAQKQQNNELESFAGNSDLGAASVKDFSATSTQKEDIKKDNITPPTRRVDSKPRPFGKNFDYPYVKHEVLQPETGPSDLITPCHEYKAFDIASTLEHDGKLQAKLAKEVFKFATGCMNVRSNGTIHFGVMDGGRNSDYVHGEIIGIPVRKKELFTDVLNKIESCFRKNSDVVWKCIRPPEFIPVIEHNSTEQRYVVEFDVVPSVNVVREKVFFVSLPNFKEESNKFELEYKTVFVRVGSSTKPVEDMENFYQGVQSRDAQREKVERAQHFTSPDLCQDLGRKLISLITSGKKQMEENKWYIIVTNKFLQKDLNDIDFLVNMKLFCVFDFDPDSMVSGLCQEYKKHHTVNSHFMQNFEGHLHLFEQTSWIFCNGRNDFKGNENPCDENTWCKTKRTFLKDCVSLICKYILPKGIFLVIFLLTSPVETPLLNTFYEFFTDMNGHDDIICISESPENFQKWQHFALQSCDMETVNRSSVVGMKMSHINATLQGIQNTTTRVAKLLPVYVKATCHLQKREEEKMCFLEILSVNHCEDSSPEFIESEKDRIERDFYRGAKVTWMNFWLAEQSFVGEMIKRDVYQDVTKLVADSLKFGINQMPISGINIYHHPGSGGSTVARQVLWNHRKDLRCAVVKPSYSAITVAEHAVILREYEEKDPQKCLPVLLLIEDCDKEYLEDLKNELEKAVNTKKIAHGIPCFILLSCRRSNTPEKMCKESPLLNVSVTHKLSAKEQRQFARKRQILVQQVQPEFILTFVLMCEEFEHQTIAKYVKQFVQNLVQDIDSTSDVTKLISYIALLNTYVENSFISQSHCEDFLSLQVPIRGKRFQQHTFESSLSDQAKLVLIHLRDEKTHIKSIRIIHQLVANEILSQLLGDKQQSDLALDLLHNDKLFEHRFGREDYRKFLRELFIRRYKISKGDKSDSLFSPLIEHVRKNENPGKAIELLQEAYKRFKKNAYVAQQLARLSYWHEKFEEAEQWAETAATILRNNSYILDTRGQVYRRWFTAKCKALENTHKTAESTADAIETALKAIACFQECQNAAVVEADSMNNSGFFGIVEVGCSLLELISSIDMFSDKHGQPELKKYLLTEHIPKEIDKPWEHLHGKLKNLQYTMHEALEWISEELSYFQTDLNTHEEETSKSSEMTIRRPKNWLVSKASVYGKYFSEDSLTTASSNLQSDAAEITSFMKRMIIYQLGGGNFTTIFSILDPKHKDQVKILEDIISMYRKSANIEQADLVNYIASNFALSAVSPQSRCLAFLKDLQKLSNSFLKDKSRCPSSALFLCTLLFWPESFDSDQEKESKYKTILTAVKFLQQTYWTKMKDIPPRKRRIYTHFFLGNGHAYDKFVHKSKIRNFPSVSEQRLKWVEGEIFKTPETAAMLKRVNGWTENRTVYLMGPKTENFPIHALNEHSLPAGNENVTFYLGFTFKGPVACDITVGQ